MFDWEELVNPVPTTNVRCCALVTMLLLVCSFGSIFLEPISHWYGGVCPECKAITATKHYEGN